MQISVVGGSGGCSPPASDSRVGAGKVFLRYREQGRKPGQRVHSVGTRARGGPSGYAPADKMGVGGKNNSFLVETLSKLRFFGTS
jgi:hypothetical protein